MSFIQASTIFWVVLLVATICIGSVFGHPRIAFSVFMIAFLVIGLWDYRRKSK